MNANIETAVVLIPSARLPGDLEFFRGLGFEIESIFPADAPEFYVLDGFGIRIRLHDSKEASSVVLQLNSDSDGELPAALLSPGGTRVEYSSSASSPGLSPFEGQWVLSRNADAKAWGTGRAGMEYRDLIPGRLGGHFIASHIRIPVGGPVPDYVHFHRINVQLIYCLRGWVKVVYEDQGEPFVLQAGDCVSQPPEIRHRVLESSEGLEVLEIGSPAKHETRTDRQMELPTENVNRDRVFQEQTFLHHRALDASDSRWRVTSFVAQETDLLNATRGLAGLNIVRPCEGFSGTTDGARCFEQPDAFCFWFLQQGELGMRVDGILHELAAGDALVLPQATQVRLVSWSSELEVIEFTQAAV